MPICIKVKFVERYCVSFLYVQAFYMELSVKKNACVPIYDLVFKQLLPTILLVSIKNNESAKNIYICKILLLKIKLLHSLVFVIFGYFVIDLKNIFSP